MKQYQTIDSLFSKQTGGGKRSALRKSLLWFQKFFAVTYIKWFDMLVEQLKREEKRHANWTMKQYQTIDSLFSKQTRGGEKENCIDEKVCSGFENFCGHVYQMISLDMLIEQTNRKEKKIKMITSSLLRVYDQTLS